jgi:hypothetical protein
MDLAVTAADVLCPRACSGDDLPDMRGPLHRDAFTAMPLRRRQVQRVAATRST